MQEKNNEIKSNESIENVIIDKDTCSAKRLAPAAGARRRYLRSSHKENTREHHVLPTDIGCRRIPFCRIEFSDDKRPDGRGGTRGFSRFTPGGGGEGGRSRSGTVPRPIARVPR